METNNMKIEYVHISSIRHGDYIMTRDDKIRTVDRKYIKFDPFMGISLYGDCYNLGTILVKRVIYLCVK